MFNLQDLVHFLATHSPVDEAPEHGNLFDATSDAWKHFCDRIPCTGWMGWPGYATAVYEAVINGETVIIQAWKGHCERAPALGAKLDANYNFPGGMGAEVGVYRKDPNREFMTPADLVFDPLLSLTSGLLGSVQAQAQARAMPLLNLAGLDLDAAPLSGGQLSNLIGAVGALSPDDLSLAVGGTPDGWSPGLGDATQGWLDLRFTPYADAALPPGDVGLLGPDASLLYFLAPGTSAFRQWFPAVDIVRESGHPVTFSLKDPQKGELLIDSYSTDSYWTCKWMRAPSYSGAWKHAWNAKHSPNTPDADLPFSPHEMHLDFSVGGQNYEWHEGREIIPV